jgi:glycosidase
MNVAALGHRSDSRYSYSLGGTKARIILRTARGEGFRAVELIWWDSWENLQKGGFADQMEIIRRDGVYDYYQKDNDSGHPGYDYVFRLTEKDGKVSYFSESGVTDHYDFREAFMDGFTFPFPNKDDETPENAKFQGRLFYQIFPDRFASSDLHKPFISQAWDTEKPDNLYFAGGDFKGMRERLPYLRSLGVGAVYLTPIHPAGTAHRYDVEDYLSVDPKLGTEEDFRGFVKAAHEAGIFVVMDLGFNHSSNKNKLFLDVAAKGRASPYHDWYFIDGEKPSARKPLNYLSFAGVPEMPKLNTSNPEVQEYLCRVGERWLRDFGVDGFRLDVAFDVSHAFWRKFRERCLAANPACVLIGEDWLNSESRLGPEWDSVMNYPFRLALLRFREEGHDATWLADRLNGLLMRYRDQHARMMLNLLSSHDVPRWITLLDGDRDYFIQSYALTLFYPGWPCLYYGDEIFMDGGQDPYNRKGMRWESPEFGSPDHAILRKLLSLRGLEALKKGEARIEAAGEVLAIERSLGADSCRLEVNLGAQAAPLAARPLIVGRKVGSKLEKGGLAVYGPRRQ